MKRRRLKRPVQAGRRPWVRYGMVGSLVGLVVLLVSLLGRAFTPLPAGQPSPEPTGRMAAIIDQVALTTPNPAFTEQALQYLIRAGYDVDVYEGADITVPFMRRLPSLGYDLIVFRTHSTNDFRGIDMPGDPVFLYTGEPHNRYRYTYYQLTRQIMAGRILYEEEAPPLFIVGPEFVRKTMQGQFNDTLLLIGGCDSLSTPVLAEAFIERGASAVVGWNGLVDLTHNDRTLLYLLRSLTVDGLSVDQAVARTQRVIGPDPTFQSMPTYFASLIPQS